MCLQNLDVVTNALADSGSIFNIMQEDLFKLLLLLKGVVRAVKPATESAMSASGLKIEFRPEFTLNLRICLGIVLFCSAVSSDFGLDIYSKD